MWLKLTVTTILIVGVDSDLAKPLVSFARKVNWRVIGTSRRDTSSLLKVDKIYRCDIASTDSVESCVSQIYEEEISDRLVSVFLVGTLAPIGLAGTIDINDWNYSFIVNGLGPMNFIQKLLHLRPDFPDVFVTFAGNGTNSAPTHFSAYTLSKIMLIKAMEILASEYPKKAFVSLGTGWMKSKIHNSVLSSTSVPEDIHTETLRRMNTNEFGNPEMISAFFEKIFSLGYEQFSGRNFSLQGDLWKEGHFWEKLTESPVSNKLRRSN